MSPNCSSHFFSPFTGGTTGGSSYQRNPNAAMDPNYDPHSYAQQQQQHDNNYNGDTGAYDAPYGGYQSQQPPQHYGGQQQVLFSQRILSLMFSSFLFSLFVPFFLFVCSIFLFYLFLFISLTVLREAMLHSIQWLVLSIHSLDRTILSCLLARAISSPSIDRMASGGRVKLEDIVVFFQVFVYFIYLFYLFILFIYLFIYLYLFIFSLFFL